MYLNKAISHLNSAKAQRNHYNSCIDYEAPENSTCLVISFDLAQNVSYLSCPQRTGKSYFCSARKCNIFGILNEQTKIQTKYLIDENESIGKGPNATVSMLHHYLEANLADIVIAFADNCVAQNKNNTMIHNLSWRICSNLNQQISLNFLLTGHTKFGPDRMFGVLKSKFAQSTVDCYEEFVKCVSTSSINGHNVVVRGESVVWSKWDQYLEKFNRTLTGK